MTGRRAVTTMSLVEDLNHDSPSFIDSDFALTAAASTDVHVFRFRTQIVNNNVR